MSYLGTGLPKFELVRQDEDGFMTVVTTFTMPRPAWRKSNWRPEIVEVRNYDGTILERRNFYRFNPILNFVNLSASDFQNLVTIANWQEEIRYYPDSGQKWNAIVRVERFEPFYTNNKIQYDSGEIELLASTRRNRIVTLDNYYILRPRTMITDRE